MSSSKGKRLRPQYTVSLLYNDFHPKTTLPDRLQSGLQLLSFETIGDEDGRLSYIQHVPLEIEAVRCSNS